MPAATYEACRINQEDPRTQTRYFLSASKIQPWGKNISKGTSKSKASRNGLTYFPNHCRVVAFAAPLQALYGLLGASDGVSRFLAESTPSPVDRPDGAISLLSLTDLPRQLIHQFPALLHTCTLSTLILLHPVGSLLLQPGWATRAKATN